MRGFKLKVTTFALALPFLILNFVVGIQLAVAESPGSAMSPQEGLKKISLNCGFGGVSFLGSFKFGLCRPSDQPNSFYQVTLMGGGANFGVEGGKLTVNCTVHEGDDFPGYYVGPNYYVTPGKSAEGRLNSISFSSSNGSSCELTSNSYGFLFDIGWTGLEIARYW
jgi:hypothetical protein